MEELKLEFDYWEALKKHMLETYPNDVIFMYDPELSYFDKGDEPLLRPKLFKFNSISEFITWSETAENIDMIHSLCVLWVNGVMDDEVIYKLRG